MNCTVEQRNRARRVIQALGKRSDVIGTDLVSTAIDPSNSWTIEITFDSEELPPEITSLLGDGELTIRDVGPRQSWRGCCGLVDSDRSWALFFRVVGFQ